MFSPGGEKANGSTRQRARRILLLELRASELIPDGSLDRSAPTFFAQRATGFAGVIVFTVSGSDQSQKMWLFPFNPPLTG